MSPTTTKKKPTAVERVYINLEPKARISFSLSTLAGKEKPTVHRFKISETAKAAKLMAQCKGALIQTGSSVNHPDEYDMPEDFTFDNYWDEIGKILGPSDESLVQWATLAVAAISLGVQVPESVRDHLVKAGYFTKKGRALDVITAKGVTITSAFITEHLK